MTPHKRKAKRKSAGDKKKKWSARAMRESDALDLEGGIFKSSDPVKIARSLKHSAEKSKRRKSSPCRSAMSMLTFFIDRAGKDLPAERKHTLEQAKDALRMEFGKA